MAELILTPNAGRGIPVPAWDDVLHVVPRDKPTTADKRAVDHALIITNTRSQPVAVQRDALTRLYADGRGPADVSQAAALEVLKRREIAEHIRSSAIPAWRQKMISVLTALDNVEDDISTLAWIARPIIARIPGGTAINKVLQGTSTTLNRLEQIAAGPTIYGRRGKERAAKQTAPDVRASKAKTGLLQRGLGWVQKNWGHLLEAGQSLDTHFGVGISLGAIFGALEETQDRALLSAWYGAKYIVGSAAAAVPGIPTALAEVLRDNADADMSELRRVGDPLIATLSSVARQVARSASPIAAPLAAAQLIDDVRNIQPGKLWDKFIRSARGAAGIAGENPYYSAGDHAIALLSAHSTLPVEAELLRALTALRPELDLEYLATPPTRVTDPVTRAILEEQHIRLDAGGAGAGDAAAPTLTCSDIVAQSLTDYQANNHAWLPPRPSSPAAAFTHALTAAAVPSTAALLTDHADGTRIIYPPDVRAEMMLYDTGMYPPIGTTTNQLQAWLGDQVAAIEAEPEDYDERTAREITARHW